MFLLDSRALLGLLTLLFLTLIFRLIFLPDENAKYSIVNRKRRNTSELGLNVNAKMSRSKNKNLKNFDNDAEQKSNFSISENILPPTHESKTTLEKNSNENIDFDLNSGKLLAALIMRQEHVWIAKQKAPGKIRKKNLSFAVKNGNKCKFWHKRRRFKKKMGLNWNPERTKLIKMKMEMKKKNIENDFKTRSLDCCENNSNSEYDSWTSNFSYDENSLTIDYESQSSNINSDEKEEIENESLNFEQDSQSIDINNDEQDEVKNVCHNFENDSRISNLGSDEQNEIENRSDNFKHDLQISCLRNENNSTIMPDLQKTDFDDNDQGFISNEIPFAFETGVTTSTFCNKSSCLITEPDLRRLNIEINEQGGVIKENMHPELEIDLTTSLNCNKEQNKQLQEQVELYTKENNNKKDVPNTKLGAFLVADKLSLHKKILQENPELDLKTDNRDVQNLSLKNNKIVNVEENEKSESLFISEENIQNLQIDGFK